MIKRLLVIFSLISNLAFGQANQNGGRNGQANHPNENAGANGQVNGGAGGGTSSSVTNNRISFLVGGGPSYIGTHLYEDPIVNKTNNNVIIADATRLK